MPRRFHHPKDSESGQALVEFALVLPLLMLVLLGIVNLARAYEQWNEQTSYANAAARYIAVGKPYTTAGIPPSGACVAVSLPGGASSYGVGDPVKVVVKSTFNFANFVLPSTVISGSATSRIESAPASTPATPACP